MMILIDKHIAGLSLIDRQHQPVVLDLPTPPLRHIFFGWPPDVGVALWLILPKWENEGSIGVK
jgi:hypothetical protein